MGSSKINDDGWQRSYSPDVKQRWSTLWSYLNTTLGWTYQYVGVGDKSLWFRPERNLKNVGELGKDHFSTKEDVVAYCDQHNIGPPPVEKKKEEDKEKEESPSSTETFEMERKKKVGDWYPNGTKISK